MLNLIAKDLKLLFGGGGKRQRTMRALFLLLALVALVLIEVFVYHQILSKMMSFKDAPASFTTVFLFIISVLMMGSALIQAEKLFFNAADSRDMAALPVSTGKMIFSKMLLLFGTQYILSFIFIYPVLVSYGILANKMFIYYFLCIFYPVLTFFFEAGIALVLVYPYHKIRQFLRERPLTQFIVAVVLMAVFAFLYGQLLNLFLNLISGSGVNDFFTEDNMNRLNEMKSGFVVSTYLVDLFLLRSSRGFVWYVAFTLISFGAGVGLIVPLYAAGRGQSSTRHYERKFDYKPTSPEKALFKKEFALLFRDGESLFGYAGLLIVQPYLCFLVVFALNQLFTTGALAYYLVSLPGFSMYLDVFLILCFAGVIAGGGASFISRERGSVKIIKMMPIDPNKQMLIKTSIPVIASTISLFFTVAVLWISKQINVGIALVSFFGGAIFLLVFNLLSFAEEMKRKVGENANHFYSNAYTYVVPILFVVVAALLSLLRLNSAIIFLIGFMLILVTTVPEGLLVFFHRNRMWDEMEVSN